MSFRPLGSSYFNVVLNINSNTTNLNLYDYIIANSSWRNTSSQRLRAIININSGVIVSASTTANYALTIPANGSNSFRTNDLIIINNNGTITGQGGAGGLGGYGAAGSRGGDGGPAIFTGRNNVFLNNQNIIAGGGGGGGGGGGWSNAGQSCVLGKCYAVECGCNCRTCDYPPDCAGAATTADACPDGRSCTGNNIKCYSYRENNTNRKCKWCAKNDCTCNSVGGTYSGGTGGSGAGTRGSATTGAGGGTNSGSGGNGGVLGSNGIKGGDSSQYLGGSPGLAGNWVNGFSLLKILNQGTVYGTTVG